jgi:hypothetical protein
MTNYIIGPWCGEFGSEVLDFIPYIRTIRKDYLKNDHVIAYCSPGKELLYEFVDEYWIFPDTFTPKINSREFYTKWGTLVNSQTSYHLTYKDAPVSDVFTQLESNITEKLAGQDVVCIVPFYNLAEYSGVNLRYYSIHKPLNWTGISMLQTQQDILCPFLSSSIIPTHVALRTQINNTPKVEKLIALFPRNKLCEPWRNWPGEHWKKLAEILLSIGYSVAIFGS